jgi:hypothetical protein
MINGQEMLTPAKILILDSFMLTVRIENLTISVRVGTKNKDTAMYGWRV